MRIEITLQGSELHKWVLKRGGSLAIATTDAGRVGEHYGIIDCDAPIYVTIDNRTDERSVPTLDEARLTFAVLGDAHFYGLRPHEIPTQALLDLIANGVPVDDCKIQVAITD